MRYLLIQKLRFREATISDISAMADIRLLVKENVLSNPARVTLKMYQDYLDLLGRGWVCEIDGKVVGFSYAAKEDSSIWALFVLPEYEGRGVGKGLLKLAVAWLFSLGNETVKLGTSANTRADRFYAAQGWIRGEMKDDIEVGYRLARDIAS
jgi:GNAT superfamily N-acetyltransferase